MNNKIRAFFDKHILTLHKYTKTGKVHYLDLEFDSARDSYFMEPAHSKYHYLSTANFENVGELKDYLIDFWKDEPELLNIIPDLAILAYDLKEEHKDHSAELSPFIYAMF